ncbi:MAG: hypothetical protein Fur0021_00960 [Candidatus Promineifilaceae bacterium]
MNNRTGAIWRQAGLALIAVLWLAGCVSNLIVPTSPVPTATASPADTTTATDAPPAPETTAAAAYPPPLPTRTPPAYALPSPVASRTPLAYPAITVTPLPPHTVTPHSTMPFVAYFALFTGRPLPPPTPTATPTFTPAPTHTPAPTPTPTIDFNAVRAQLQANGQDLGFVKIGFHVALGGNMIGISDWMHRQDAAGVPFFLKSADNAGPLLEAQEIARASGVPHTLVFRRTGPNYDTPNYDLPPDQAAAAHWQLHKEAFPPELDPSLIWLETINEVDKNRSVWLAEFALHTAQLALADGYRWAAFGWSSGEPEVSDWQSPAMLRFLRLAGQYPDRIAVALHEYSYSVDEIGHDYPYKLGRFQLLFQVCDDYGIPRPTVLITEWGWTYDNVPGPDEAMRDIAWASALYAPYPQVKGAALWYLGPGYNEIANKAHILMNPMRDYALGNYFAIPLPPAQAAINPEQYRP